MLADDVILEDCSMIWDAMVEQSSVAHRGFLSLLVEFPSLREALNQSAARNRQPATFEYIKF